MKPFRRMKAPMTRREEPLVNLLGAARRPQNDARRSSGLEERELLARVRERDLHAFERLYRIYQPRLTRFLFNLVQRPQLVEEVLNDTMMVVWDTADSFRGTSKLSTWDLLDRLPQGDQGQATLARSGRGPDVRHAGQQRSGSDEELDHQRLHEALMKAMDQLSSDHRAVVDLTYFHGMGYREIADIMNCPVDTVKTRMFHARRG
jgi:RNA polymerase sigma-70 factor (ECF subfamily)